MVTVSYNLVLNDAESIDLDEIFKESLDNTSYDLDIDEFQDCLTEKCFKKIGEDQDQTFIKFNIYLDCDIIGFDVVKEILESFNEELKSIKPEAVFKFYDDILLDQMKRFYHKIFEIEMRIREIVTFIFVDTYATDFYDLFTEIQIGKDMKYQKSRELEENLKFEVNSLKKKKEDREDYLRYLLENESFYITFSGYKQLLVTKQLQQNDLFNIATRSKTYQKFRENICDRGIKEQIYKEFLNEIKDPLDNLEPLRNCVAHNRTLSDLEGENLELICDELDEIINKFVEKLKEKNVLNSF